MSRNQLDQETSPYLLLHKDNPVHWYPWGPEAFAAAEESGKPILLSIGYTACHWCHVMARESFADPETAALMNEMFVNVKVDREERPDIDQIYQAAANQMGNNGGWPLNIFLTPRGAPFMVGTYLPKEEKPNQPSFKNILNEVSRLYREQPEPAQTNSQRIVEGLTTLWNRNMNGQLDPNALDTVAIRVAQRFDIFFGGPIGPTKFPSFTLVDLLWHAFLRSGAQQFSQLVTTTLDNMLLGGIYDHIGGGMMRYATDERWFIPHFEKMLSDNAMLIDTLTSLWQFNRNSLCGNRLVETIGWLTREMMVGDAFASSLDSDTEGAEGAYYVWTEAEIDACLMGTFAQRFKTVYGVTREGNFQGRNALHRLSSPASFPQNDADEALLAKQRELLLKARQNRVPPMRDDKVLADWNGLAIAAIANAGAAMQRPEWIQQAARAFDFILKALGDGDKLAHSWHAGKRGHGGFSDDYANMTRAALILWEVTGDKKYLEQAKRWVHTLNVHFWDTALGGYYYTSDQDDSLIVRTRPIFDSATPSANSTMAAALGRLFMATQDPEYATRAGQIIRAFAAETDRAFITMGNYFNSVEYLALAIQIIVIGPANSTATLALSSAVLGRCYPNRFLVVVTPDQTLPEGHIAHGKTMQNGMATAYVCQGTNVSEPITNPVALSQMLQLPRGRPSAAPPR